MSLKVGMKAKKGLFLRIGGLLWTTFCQDIFFIYYMVYDQGVLWLPLEWVNQRSDCHYKHLLDWNRKCQIKDFYFLEKGFKKPPLIVTRGYRNIFFTSIPKSKTKRIHLKQSVLPFLNREQSGLTYRSVLISTLDRSLCVYNFHILR